MMEIEPFYRIHDLHPTATGYFPLTQQNATVFHFGNSEKKNISYIFFLL